MAYIKILVIKETEKEIKNLFKQSIPSVGQRFRVLLILKQNEKAGISKREVAKLAGVVLNSVQNRRTLYLNAGIEGLIKHRKTDFKPSAFNFIEDYMLKTKLNDPQSGHHIKPVNWSGIDDPDNIQFLTLTHHAPNKPWFEEKNKKILSELNKS